MIIQRCGKMSEKWADCMSNTPELSGIVWDTLRSDLQKVRSRDLEKYAEVFTEGVECWRIDSNNNHLFYLFCFVHKISYSKK